MKSLPNENKKNDVQMHINKGFEIIDEFLPVYYMEKVKQKLAPEDRIRVTDNQIRNVRRRLQSAKANIIVFNALVEVAMDNKKDVEKLSKLTSSIPA